MAYSTIRSYVVALLFERGAVVGLGQVLVEHPLDLGPDLLLRLGVHVPALHNTLGRSATRR
jgi:hypothetical protein